jgi:pyrimidine-specific ribonucleoside hydrolase
LIPLLIDCDPGHDDALAIFLAAAFPEKLGILGITTVAGNQVLEKTTINARKIVELIGLNVPVAAGAAGPLARELATGGFAHGETGMDGPELPEPAKACDGRHAAEFMASRIRSSPEPVAIVALGPLTNIALLLSVYPDVKERIACISLMGGAIALGNMTAAAEFNIYVDPEAARIVFRSGVPLVMSGLDVTEKALIFDSEIESLRHRGKVSRVAWKLLEYYSVYGRETLGMAGSALHDPCAVAWLLRPDLFESEMLHVDVETAGELTRGMTLADRRVRPEKPPNVRVLMNVDRKAFINLLMEALIIHDTLCYYK